MEHIQIIWDLEDDEDGNYWHIVVTGPGITAEEVDEVLRDCHAEATTSQSSGMPITFGWTATGRYLAVVFEHIDDDPLTLRPITAYEAPPPKGDYMSSNRIHRKSEKTAEEKARLREIRDGFQREKPSLEQLVESGEFNEAVSQGEYISIREAVAALKRAREAAGLSLADVEERSGIDKSALSRIETGQHLNPTIGTLVRYAQALGKRWVWSLEDDPASVEVTPTRTPAERATGT